MIIYAQVFISMIVIYQVKVREFVGKKILFILMEIFSESFTSFSSWACEEYNM
jgi:hypothetical protein